GGGLLAVAGDAAVLGEEALAGGFGAVIKCGIGGPFFVVGGGHDDDAAAHEGVGGATVFGAEEMKFAELGGGEPLLGVAAGEDVLLDAKGGDEEGVNDILGGHLQFDGLAERDVKFIDFLAAAGV